MKKVILAVLLVLMATSLMFVGCSENEQASSSDGEGKIAIIGNKRGSTGFIDEAYAGADKAAADFGKTVEIVEIIETADYETQGRFLAESGDYDLIIFVGANVADVVALMAGDYPEQRISIVDTKLEGFENVRSVSAIDPEQAFLSGVLSGIVTKGQHKDVFPFSNDENVLSYAGGGDVPTSRAGAAGYIAGAKYVNPDVEVIYTIVGSWSDPARAKEITLQNIGRGADIATGNCGSGIFGVLEAAKEQGAYYIATSPADNDPEYSISCSVKKTDAFVYNEIQSIVEETWAPGHYQFGIAHGICDISFDGLAFNGKIPADIMEVINASRQSIVDGELVLPTDPTKVDEWAKTNQYY